MGSRFSLPRGRTPRADPPPAPAPEAPPPSPPTNPAETVQEIAARMRSVIQQDLARLEDRSVRLSESDRRNNLKACTVALKGLAEVTGELREIPDSKLIKLPGFRRVLERLGIALTPWPEAVHAVGIALKELSEE